MWQDRAACARSTLDGVTFFPQGKEGGGGTPLGHRQREVALSYCAVCPVRPECREFSLATNQVYGIWGGLTEKARKDERKRRRLALQEAS
jgi:WhiB family redox-sensing transcriptional regulator